MSNVPKYVFLLPAVICACHRGAAFFRSPFFFLTTVQPRRVPSLSVDARVHPLRRVDTEEAAEEARERVYCVPWRVCTVPPGLAPLLFVLLFVLLLLFVLFALPPPFFPFFLPPLLRLRGLALGVGGGESLA